MDPAAGRCDLPLPDGACYLATTIDGAVLEALQGFGEGLLPESELRARAGAEVREVAQRRALRPGRSPCSLRWRRGVGLEQCLVAPQRAGTECLSAHGISVTVDPDLPVVRLQDSGLV